ncbi:hypothetical protein CLAC_06995 [Corynebacterium lactis RW2-5]|uniref:Uncharacterized protein n=1 Tax=Corynebacterium lactis RW2-5 TaxID=1408189 RepID=A0A0K2H3B9_9CORY|nr:hypothetical protein CLAC_06995 [Corynebacterium lactis RW2-5]
MLQLAPEGKFSGELTWMSSMKLRTEKRQRLPEYTERWQQ